MLKWIGFLVLLAVSVGIFVFAPMALVSYFIALFVPAGMESVGTAFSLGLSLSIVANSFLSRWKSMRLSLVFLVILSVTEAMMSGTTLYLKALADNRLDLVVGLGILAVVSMQEAVLISGGIGMSLVLDRIGDERERQAAKAERRKARQAATVTTKSTPATPETPTSPPGTTNLVPTATTLTRQERLDAICRANVARNGA